MEEGKCIKVHLLLSLKLIRLRKYWHNTKIDEQFSTDLFSESLQVTLVKMGFSWQWQNDTLLSAQYFILIVSWSDFVLAFTEI